MDAKQVMDIVLGHKSGYCKGIGYGPSIPSTKQSYLESENAQLKETNSELSQSLKEMKDAVMRNEARQAAFEKFILDKLENGSESTEN
ncbi:hypothetical protein LINPERPRIM_LOCUS37684 [Linum perenne]